MQISAASGDESEGNDERSPESSFAASGDKTERFDLHSSYCNYIYLFCCFLYVENLLIKCAHK